MQLLCAFSLIVALTPAPQAAPAAKAPAAKAPAAKTAQAAKPADAKGARTVELTAGDDMKFSTTTIAAKPGETLHVVLKSTGTIPKIAMGHNFVALKTTADPVEFNKASMMARDTDYVPAAMKADVLGATKLAGPGETVDVTFKVPAKAGSYPYMCTFPGHYAAGMKGQIVVK
jgi:azurin